MYSRQTGRSWAAAIGLAFLGVQCALAQVQSQTSPAVDRELYHARSVVMDMRVPMRQSTEDVFQNNNLLITGNVGGAKHFRPPVPYRANNELKAALPSNSLSNFFRLSQQQDLRTSSPIGYTPYYSATSTVTHMQVGQPGVVTPPTSSQMSPTAYFKPPPSSPLPGLTSQETTGPLESLPEPTRQRGAETWAEDPSEGLLFMPEVPDVAQFLHMPDGTLQMDVVLTPDVNRVPASSGDTAAAMRIPDPNSLGRTVSRPSLGVGQDPNAPEAMVGSGYAMTSKTAMHTYAQTKFNTFMRAGETYLKQGQYDRAQDAYSLASVYQPGHILAVAGKSHALLAKRAYSSSALHLIRVLDVLPDYAKTDMGLPDLVGGFKAVTDHIKRLESHTEGRYVPELRLLLAFIYLQVGDVGLAQMALKDVPPDSSYETARIALLEASRSVEP